MDLLVYKILSVPYNSKNGKQIEAILKTLTRKQKYKIQRFIKNILYGKILLTDAEYRKLSKHKTLIRNLSSSKYFSIKYLKKNYNVFNDIISIMLKKDNNESNTKNDISTIRRMGKETKNDKKSRCNNRNKQRNRNRKTYSSSEEDIFESEIEEKRSYGNEEEEEEGFEDRESIADKSSQCSEEEEEEEEE